MKGVLSRQYGYLTCENPAVVIKNVIVSDLLGNVFPESFDGLVDTGADRSVIPLRICDALGLPILEFSSAVGFDGTVSQRSIHWAYFKIEGIDDMPLKVFVVPRRSILLGRDFLRSMLLIMDNSPAKYAVCPSTQWKTFLLKLVGAL